MSVVCKDGIMNRLLDLLGSGWKTYIAGLGLIAFALVGLFTGRLASDQIVEALLAGFGLLGLRHALTKNGR